MKADTSRTGRLMWLVIMIFGAAGLFISACSPSSDISAGVGTGGTGSVTAVAKLDVTDAPAGDYAHVYVTVTGVAFHASTKAAFSGYSSGMAAGWRVSRLAAPKTIDLARLANGTMFADLNGNSSLFEGIVLPAGSYQQIRIFLASTEDAYVGTITGLTYNNEVQLNGDGAHYPLRVPSASEGIKVLPESPVVVAGGSNISLALDFNLNNDVIRLSPGGATEFMLKPRLGFFDMGRVGAITGTIGFANLSTSRLEVKAEQVQAGVQYRTVARMTSVDRSTGRFNLYPLQVFGNNTTAMYDILIRGRNVKTAIVKGVKVHKNTTPANGVDLGTIAMQAGSEFTAQLGSAMHPSGAWLNFYQTVSGDTVPYEVRYLHLDPYIGRLPKPVELSGSPVLVAEFTPGAALTFSEDSSSQGRFSVVADAAFLYERGVPFEISGVAGQVVSIAATNPPRANLTATLDFVFDMALLGTGMGPGMGMGAHGIALPTSGQIFVTHGGMIVDGLGDASVASAMSGGGGSGFMMTVNNLPGNVDGAVYSIYALGRGGYVTSGTAHNIDLSKGRKSATIRMK